MNFDEMKQSVELIKKVMNEANDINRKDAWAMDKEQGKDALYTEYDDATGSYCVFGTESGFAYEACGSEEEANEKLEELKTQLDEDYLEPKDEKLYGDAEEDEEEGLSEDYSEGQYGQSREEIIANIAMKYLGVTKESFGVVEVDVENVWTALNDAFEGGVDLSGNDEETTEEYSDSDNSSPAVDVEIELEVEAKLKEAKLNESSDVKGSVKMGDGSKWQYVIDGDTGELFISTTFKEVPANTTIISEEVHNKLQEVLFSDDMDMSEKMGKLEELKAEIALTVREFFNQSTITDHVNETVSDVLDAYAGSLSMQIDENIRKRM